MIFKSDVLLNEPNLNGYIHTKECMTKAVEDFMKTDNRVGRLLINGYDKNNSGVELDLLDVSHTINSLTIEDNVIVAEIKILDTEIGKTLKAARPDKLRFVPFGMGKLKEKKIIDYKLISMDFIPQEK